MMSEELTAKKRAALNRLKTARARGHMDAIIRMVESDAYCVDVMKQISAVQSALERTNRVMLHNHLETCFSEAVMGGQGEKSHRRTGRRPQIQPCSDRTRYQS